MKDSIIVVAALIEKDGKYLIAKRSTGDETVRGCWEFPGGKTEPGEAEVDAVERELNEEFGVTVKAGELIAVNTHEYPKRTITLKLYKCDYVDGVFELRDHSEFAWVDLSNFGKYNFAAADIPFLKKIEENEKK